MLLECPPHPLGALRANNARILARLSVGMVAHRLSDVMWRDISLGVVHAHAMSVTLTLALSALIALAAPERGRVRRTITMPRGVRRWPAALGNARRLWTAGTQPAGTVESGRCKSYAFSRLRSWVESTTRIV